jgi:HTH-type transcriptional regulator/antitoxin HipB
MDEQVRILGQCIKNKRKIFGLNQSQLAELSGTSLNFISQLERGKTTLRLNLLLAVLKVLGLELHLQHGKNIVSFEENLN